MSAQTLTLYGLKKCSTCQKALSSLQDAGWTVSFVDIRETPFDRDGWRYMYEEYGEKLVNRASLTWRGMSQEERAEAPDAQLAAKPSLMKRPAIQAGDQHLLGWTANVKRALGVEA